MRLKLDSDDVLYLIQELACVNIERHGTQAGDALQNAHTVVQEYLGIDIEFVVEGYDGAIHDLALEMRRQQAHHDGSTLYSGKVDYRGQPA